MLESVFAVAERGQIFLCFKDGLTLYWRQELLTTDAANFLNRVLLSYLCLAMGDCLIVCCVGRIFDRGSDAVNQVGLADGVAGAGDGVNAHGVARE
jgi:hypothetical protein